MTEFEDAVEKAFHTFGELQTMEDGIVADDMFVYKRRKRKNKDAEQFRREHDGKFSPHLGFVEPHPFSDGYILSEEICLSLNSYEPFELKEIGETLRDIHEEGKEYQSSGRLDKYCYDKKWQNWELVMENNHTTLEYNALQKRQEFYDEFEGLIDNVSSEYWNQSQFCHRDFHLGNIVESSGNRGIVATDWEFADLFYPGIEVARMSMDVTDRSHPKHMKYFLSGYIEQDDDMDFYRSALGQYANYLTFNVFPFDRDYSVEKKESLISDRDRYLETMKEERGNYLDSVSNVLFHKNK